MCLISPKQLQVFSFFNHISHVISFWLRSLFAIYASKKCFRRIVQHCVWLTVFVTDNNDTGLLCMYTFYYVLTKTTTPCYVESLFFSSQQTHLHTCSV